jgi:putative intracellular protease/amidase
VAALRQKHVLYVLPRIGVWYDDFGPVRDVLAANGVKVSVAANAKGVCHLAQKSRGAPVPIDVTLSRDMDVSPYDAVIFGGVGIEEYADENHEAGKIVRQVIQSMEKSNKTVAALCTGQGVLAAAGTLQGKRAAYNQLVSTKFPMKAEWRKDKNVETHDHLITGGRPEDAAEFAEAILEALKKK